MTIRRSHGYTLRAAHGAESVPVGPANRHGSAPARRDLAGAVESRIWRGERLGLRAGRAESARSFRHFFAAVLVEALPIHSEASTLPSWSLSILSKNCSWNFMNSSRVTYPFLSVSIMCMTSIGFILVRYDQERASSVLDGVAARAAGTPATAASKAPNARVRLISFIPRMVPSPWYWLRECQLLSLERIAIVTRGRAWHGAGRSAALREGRKEAGVPTQARPTSRARK